MKTPQEPQEPQEMQSLIQTELNSCPGSSFQSLKLRKDKPMHALPIVGAALFAGLTASAASAMPVIQPSSEPVANLVTPVASWRYHNNCAWRDGRWVVDLGAGRMVVCRPNRPGRDYRWHREGERFGWYDSRRRAWHNDRW